MKLFITTPNSKPSSKINIDINLCESKLYKACLRMTTLSIIITLLKVIKILVKLL